MKPKNKKQSCKKISKITAEVLINSQGGLCYTVEGEEYKNILDSLPQIEISLQKMGFPINVNFAITQFIIECLRNAMKARGSKILSDKYGSFEKVLDIAENPLTLINNTITEAYKDTVITFIWENLPDTLVVSITNNTCLNEYLSYRIEKSLNRDHEITTEELEEISSEKSIYNTKASGMGLGLWMVVQAVKDIGGKISFSSNSEITKFSLEIPKNKEK